MKHGSGSRSGWAIFLVCCALLVSVIDALLLEASQTLFTAGFNGIYIRGPLQLGSFATVSLVSDLFLVSGVWALALPWLQRRSWTGLQKLASVCLLSLALPLSIDFVLFQVGEVLGRMARIQILWEVSGGGLQLMLQEAALHAGPLTAALLTAGLLGGAGVWSLGRLERATGWGHALLPPRPPAAWKTFGVATALGFASLIATDQLLPRMRTGLSPKPSVRVMTALVNFVTDVDRDGFGLLSRPRDPAPFDGSRHAFAIDRRANGIDENGLAGDLPRGATAPGPIPPGGIPEAATRRPDFLLVYLESFRADRLNARRGGRPVTPFFDELAREGASSDRAYVHSPYTIWSRAQLFGGRLDPWDGQDSLIDDFRSLGYTIAHFSGQDDSFGNSFALLGLDRVDHFYDARQDRDRRTSRGTSAGSLQVSGALLAERVGEYLEDYDGERPLFLYVNLVDTHFPYTHAGLEDLLGVDPLDRYDIQASNAEAVRATYDNAAANVDAWAREIVARFRSAIGGRDHAILVTSDHGQALFENELLGHGQSLTDDQTRAPFVLWGVGGDWPEPLGMADVRALLQQHLFTPFEGAPPRARFALDPQRRLFHFMAQIRHPHLVGLRTARGLASYDFDTGRFELFGPGGAPRTPAPEERERAFDELIWSWESLREAVEERSDRRDGRPPKRPGPA